MTKLHRAQLDAGFTMDPLECVMDGDQYHWKCIAPVHNDGQLYTFSTNVTCDHETDNCLSEPQALTPTG
jgi:hypothetical protein